jgi:hypothetical protein
MKKQLATLFLLVLCMAPGLAGPNGITMHRLQAGTPDADGWYSAVSTNGSFSVRLPGRFNDFTNPGSDDGTKLCHTLGSQSPGGMKFSATRTPILKPRKSIRDFLNDFAGGYEQTGELTEKNFLMVDGYETLDCTAKDKDVTVQFRVIGLPDGALLLMVEYPNKVAGTAAKQLVAKFFASAKILKKEAEQGVAPQSATRSESKSEGGDKPQPESNPRSR